MGIQLIGVLAAVMIWGMALPVPHEVAAADLSVRPPDALQQEWNDMMLSGRFGRIYNGQFTENSSALNREDGWIFEAPMTACGIWVGDLTERRYFLFGHGGWELEGGLLRRIDISAATIELYGKTIKRREPYMNPFPHVWFGNGLWNFGHEFFLVLRSKDHTQAQILREWFVSDSYDGRGSDLTPRGFLEYDQFSQQITVKAMSGHYEGLFIDRVHVSDRSLARHPALSAREIEPDTYSSLMTFITIPHEGKTVQAQLLEHYGLARFEQAEGWVNQALHSKESIKAKTQTGKWICLALLRRVPVDSSRSLELFVRKWDCGGYKSTYDFILLIRSQSPEKATTLRQWGMTLDGPETLFQRAFLDYNPVSGMAEVHVTDGLESTLLDQTISVSD